MKIRELLEHHGIAENPFADEDAQTDQVFKVGCIMDTYHPAWDKIYGSPQDPATAVVFGEKGSGKTALRMQMVRHLENYNADHPDSRVFVVRYDDFNPFIDRFRNRFSRRRKAPRVLSRWMIWDHMDAILSLGVTQLIDRVLGDTTRHHPAAPDLKAIPVKSLSENQRRDLALLAVLYDQSTDESHMHRLRSLRKLLHMRSWTTYWDIALGIAWTLLVLFLFLHFGGMKQLISFWPYLVSAIGWAPRWWRMLKWCWRSRGIVNSTRALQHNAGRLRRSLMQFPESALLDQPLPQARTTDSRYSLLEKLQGVLTTLDFSGMIVIVDRVDEPYLINGSSELMRLLIWPMLDNKLLKMNSLGFKLLLPSELGQSVDRENREFHERARLDKQNLVRSLDWTGQSLLDVANARLKACAMPDREPTLRELFDESVTTTRLMDVIQQLKVPRHLFKFLYRVLVTHANAHPATEPVWQVSTGTFESVFALYQRDRDAFEHGIGVV